MKYFFPLVLLSTLLVSCTKPNYPEKTQVIASVNGNEITVHQLNHELSNYKKKKINVSVASVSQNLVSKQLLTTAALSEHLNREAEYVLSMEMMKNDYLAEAYLQKKIPSNFAITSEELQSFIEENPLLYKDRKLVLFKKYTFTGQGQSLEEHALRKSMARASELETYLLEKHVRFNISQDAILSTQLPKSFNYDVRPDADNNKLIMKKNSSTVSVYYIANIVNMPLSELEIEQDARQKLIESKRKKIVQEQIDKLRKKANIIIVNKSLFKQNS